MKVGLFQFFPQTLWNVGGGERLLDKTHEELQRRGIDVCYYDLWHPVPCDVIHIFGSSYQLSDFVVTARMKGMRVVVTSIVDTTKPNWTFLFGRALDKVLPLPTVYTYRDRIYKAADCIITDTNFEQTQLEAQFRVSRQKMKTCYPGVELSVRSLAAQPFPSQHDLADFVLCVGRITSKKNQVSLAQACLEQGAPLIIIGNPSPNEPDYADTLAKIVARGGHLLQWLTNVTDDVLWSAYASAAVHAQPSYWENPGLTTLEAAVAGCKIVVSDIPTIREYVGPYAHYCNPRSVESIATAIARARSAPKSDALKKHLLTSFSWERYAHDVISVYEAVLVNH